MFKKIFLFCMLLFSSQSLVAQMVDTYDFHNDLERQRAITLAKSLRCPQCQNQNLVESNSPIAYDLRLEVYKMVNDGKTNQQIIQIMTHRFGDFVLYDPPLKTTTLLLWALPFGIIFIAILWFIYYFKSIQQPHIATLENNLSIKSQELENALTMVNSVAMITNKTKALFLISIITIIVSISLIFYITSGRLSQANMSYTKIQNKQQEVQHTTLQQHQQQKIKQVQNKLRKDKNNAEQWLQLGQLYMQLEQYDNALVAFSYAEHLTEKKAPILGLAATALYYQNHQQLNPKIIQLVDAALAQDPYETASLSLKANYAFQHKNYSQAIELWRDILDSQKQNIDRKTIIERLNTAKFLNKK